ncbi:MAG: C10 family peptidase, partial [Muribaculaceae bacterium]|nr:C10 family peptidase [Muribaculaceae bacterium]
MSKFRILLLLTILAVASVSVEMRAEQVSEAQARSVAARFMRERGLGVVATTQPSKAMRRTANVPQTYAAYYVFNAEKDRGWVIVSGDDRTEQVLGYSDKGNFDPANVPENMKAWLNQYVEEIAMLDEGVITIDRSQSNVHPKGGSAVSPLLTSQWDQSAPFNLRCPTYNGNYCVTGCTATAMAQIMYYHKWPSSTSQAIPGYTQSDDENYSMHGTTYSALNSANFDWNNMKDYYSSSETSTTDNSNNAVARLMRYCGQSVEMRYGVSGSNAVSSSEVFVDYFRYSPKARKLFRVDYSYSQWENFILTELRANRPIIYGGRKHNGGHDFVCDGYDGNGYYHFNWGWRGSYDGYFLLTSLNPNGGGIGSAVGNNGYMLGNAIIIGLEPNTVSTSERNSVARCFELKIGDNTTYTRSNSSEPFQLYLNARIWNEMPVSRTYNFGWGVYKADGFTPFKQYAFSATHSLDAHEKSESIIRTFQFGQNFANGTYYLRPICRETGNYTWFPCHFSGLDYIKAVINGNTLTLTVVNKAINNVEETTDGVSANINAYSPLKKVHRPLSVLVKVKNNSLADNIFFYLWANNERVGANSINLSSGSSGYVSISYTPTSSGTNTIKVTGDRAGNEVYCTGSVNVEPLTEASLLVRSSVPAANASNQVAGNKLTLNASITNRKTSV